MLTETEKIEKIKNEALVYYKKFQILEAVFTMLKGIEDENLKYPQEILDLGILYVSQQNFVGIKRWIEGFH